MCSCAVVCSCAAVCGVQVCGGGSMQACGGIGEALEDVATKDVGMGVGEEANSRDGNGGSDWARLG